MSCRQGRSGCGRKNVVMRQQLGMSSSTTSSGGRLVVSHAARQRLKLIFDQKSWILFGLLRTFFAMRLRFEFIRYAFLLGNQKAPATRQNPPRYNFSCARPVRKIQRFEPPYRIPCSVRAANLKPDATYPYLSITKDPASKA